MIRYRYWVLNGGLEPDYLAWARVNYFGGLTPHYVATALALLSGRWSAISRLYPPLYGAWIALVNFLGVPDLQGFRLAQILLDAFGCFLIYRVCLGLGCGRPASLIAAFAYAVTPSLAWGSTWILAESITSFLILMILALVLRARRRGRLRDWGAVGIAGSLAALTRTELGVLFVPLSAWAFFAAGRPRRRTAVLATLAGFWIPWLLVASLNFATFGRFAVASNVIFYAMFSGLGQVANDFGYYTDDIRAGKELNALGMQYHSPEAEAHWRRVYVDAWRQHPGHVLSTIVFRIKRIFLETELGSFWFPLIGLALTVCALLVLITRGHLLESAVVVGPLLVALGSLGFIYVEHRYVRYAHLSYLFALAVCLGFGAAWLERTGARFIRPECQVRGTQWARPLVAVGLLTLFLPYVSALDGLARREVVTRAVIPVALNANREGGWRSVESIEPGARGAIVEKLPGSAFRIVTSPVESGYQGLGQIPTYGVAALLVDYKVDVSGGVGYVGILRGDGTRFYRQIEVPADRPSAGRIEVSVDDPFISVVFTGISAGSLFYVRELRYLPVCVAPVTGVTRQLWWAMFPHPSSLAPSAAGKCPAPRPT